MYLSQDIVHSNKSIFWTLILIKNATKRISTDFKDVLLFKRPKTILNGQVYDYLLIRISGLNLFLWIPEVAAQMLD